MYKSALYTLLFILLFQVDSKAQHDIVNKFSQITEIIKKNYVDSVDYDTLESSFFNNLLHELDPHSAYYSAEEITDMDNRLKGHFKGIGIQYNLIEDTIIIVAVQEDSPAEKSGLLMGDRILKIDGIPVANEKIQQEKIHHLLSGEQGTSVYLTIMRPFENKIKIIKITREKIPYSSIDVYYMINEQTAYIKLSRFASITGSELNRAIKNCTHNGAKNLILDLRNNGGGILSSAVDVASEFLAQQKYIVSTSGANVKTEFFYSNKKRCAYANGNLILLVNENSASASEIVAGALQDWDRAIIVGRRTYGKALVQRPFTLADGSVIRLTIGRYYLPSGRMIQKPFSKGYSQYKNDLADRISSGELFEADKNKPVDSTQFKSLTYNRILWTYEGIMPDYFIPLDTTQYSAEQKKFINSGLFNKRVVDFCLANQLIKHNNNETDYIKNFSLSTENISALGLSNLVLNQSTEIGKAQNENFILLAKALIGEYLYGHGCYQKISNSDDEFIKKSLSLFAHQENFANFTVYPDSNE
jgi:carboxyl-terminal processing protease